MPPVLEEPDSPERAVPPGSARGRSGDGPDTEALSKDAIFELLRSSRRRGVLRYLHEREPEADIGTLAEHVAAEENDITVEALTSTQRKRVYISLYQSHLPKMGDFGVIEYDGRGSVRLHATARQLLPYLYVGEDVDHLPADLAPGPFARLGGWLRRRLGR